MTKDRPNILVVITDHQRADSLGLQQCGREVMPRLNRFASESMVFARAYTTAPLCIPARTAMATGQYPTAGIPINDFSGQAARPQTLATCFLEEAGYQVAYIGKNDIRLKPDGRTQHPASTWIDKQDYEAWLAHEGHSERPGWEGRDDAFFAHYYKQIEEVLPDRLAPSRYSHPATGSWDGPVETFRDHYFARRMSDWLEQAAGDDRPFAAFYAIPSPHPPLTVPEPYARLFPAEAIDLPPNVGQPAEGEPANREQCVARQLARDATEADHRKAWSAHLGLLRLADDLFGQLLDDLARLGLDDNTIVVFTSDHGHHLGQHRMFGINELYEQTVHVPFLVRTPGGPAGRTESPCGHLDLMPTLFEMAGMELPDTFVGRSLQDTLLHGKAPAPRPQFFQFSGQIGYGYYRRGVVTQRFKYIFDPHDIPELYDLDADPLEMRNLSQDRAYASVLRDHHELCAAWHRRQGDWIRYDTLSF